MFRRQPAQALQSRNAAEIVSSARPSPGLAWSCGKALLLGIAQLERGDSVVGAIDPVLLSIFRMVAYPSDEFCRNVGGGPLHDALVQEPAFCQKLDVSKDLLLARFGSSLAVTQEFGRGNVAGHGRKCRKDAGSRGAPDENLASDHEGPRTRFADVGIHYIALFVLIPFLMAGQQLAASRQAICDGVQGYANMLVDYTKTACVPTDSSGDTFTFLVLSSEPILAVKDPAKAWLIAVVLSLGNAMNGHPEAKAGELYVADANMETNGAYSLSIDLAKSLQKEVAAGRLELGAMYDEIQKNLVRTKLPKP